MVTTLDHVTILKTSPLRVWTVLTDFAGHAQWKPFIQLAGAAVVGGDATYTFRISGLGKAVTSSADIIRVEKPFAFAWTAGVAKLLLFEEAYELEAVPEGTRLRHSLRFSGIFAAPLQWLMARKVVASLERSDWCLERQLRRSPVQQVPSRPAPVRNGFRKQRRQK